MNGKDVRMKLETTASSHEVGTFEEYTVYSLECSTPALLRMMERGKQVANCWPEVGAMVEAAGLCQEVAAMASFQDTLDHVMHLGEVDGGMGAMWREMRGKLDRMMHSLEQVLSLKESGAIKRIFSVELPDALNGFVEVIPMVIQHVRENYMAEPCEATLAGAQKAG